MIFITKLKEIGSRRIGIKSKNIAKAKELVINKTDGNISIQILPNYQKELTKKEINQLYLSFLELGRKLYHENKEKNNISKITLDRYSLDLNTLENRYILKNDPQTYADEFTFNMVEKWANQNHLWYMDDAKNINSYFFIKSNSNFRLETLTEWLKQNFVSVETEVDDGPWLYVNHLKLIDLSIFIYLVTYSIRTLRNPKANKSIDNINFHDFIKLDGWNKELSELEYLPLLNEIIFMFEKHNIQNLYGSNKLKYIQEENRFIMITEYDDIYALIWYLFKLYLVDNFSYFDENDKRIPINICDYCGAPFIGTTKFCTECDSTADARRKANSRMNMFLNINKIKDLVNNSNCKYPKVLINKTNQLLQKSKTELYKCQKKDVDNLLHQLEKYSKNK